MIQLVAPSQTASEMFDGHGERWKGWTVFSLKRRQQKKAKVDEKSRFSKL